ncbi:putative salicylate hydroxylase [Massariosphaeria phaeospora]|uniref:Putative salicylate hydroxylase n=1 Tax=Massariosphaeria phaeospora TaxID=100035 RepID=A0A7C8MJB0_9PLEO|nr:putative salicylate hydroxylase [Massariosphaeria phaeospora]
MPLKIIVVGAGIAGLIAAIALRQAGHEVEIFEKSAFATEIGAALIISPNGARVLSTLGFSFSNARAVLMDQWSVFRGDTMTTMANVDMRAAKERFGAEAWAVHRVDLHNELLRLAKGGEGDGWGAPVKLHLGCEVVDAEAQGSIVVKGGERYTADLVVAADGLKSAVKGVVTGNLEKPTPTGLSAFRFLVDTEVLRGDAELEKTLAVKGSGASLLADVRETKKERHMMWYACRDGETQNFVGIHPSRDVEGDDAEAVKASMLEEFSTFSPGVLEIIRRSSAVKCWPLFVHSPLLTWYNNRVVLIGDSAHPMLPFGGQGANSAIEDGGTLGYVFRDVADASKVPERLELFQRARQARAARVQILSSVRAGKEQEVEEELRKWSDPPGSSKSILHRITVDSDLWVGLMCCDAEVPTNMMERTGHDYSFDVFRKCDEVLAA